MQRYGKVSPRRFASLNRQGALGKNPHPHTSRRTVTEALKTVDAEALRARARLVSLRLLDHLDSVTPSMDAKTATDALNATGKLTGAQSATIAHNHAHRLMSGEERAARAAELIQRATARLLIEGPNVSSGRTCSEDADAIPLDGNDIG